MEQFVPKIPKLHYIFRNRLSELYKIIDFHKLDGIILIAAYDCSYSKPMHQFIKWLLFGCSSLTTIDEFSIPAEFSETFMIITKQELFIFSQSSTREFFYEITSKICNVEIFITSKKDEENSETLEIQKISKFIEFTQKIKKIGIPLDYNQRQNIVLLDRWPLLTATALDCLGLGFFTMNHDIIDISKDLELFYHRIDIGAILSLINAKTEFIENTYTDFINHIQREPINKRLNTTEDNLNLNQNLELIRINYEKQKNDLYSFLKDFPDPRILYGINTNKNKKETSSTEALFKITYDFKFPSFHLTYENMDPTTGIRICRTIFLYNMQKKYLDMHQDTFQYDFIETKAYNEIYFFFNLYYILVSFFKKVQNDIILLKTNIPKVKEDIKDLMNNYIKSYIKSNNIDIKNDEDYLIKKENIFIELKKYVLLDIDNTSYQNENKVIVLRFEIKNIISIYTHRPIGSLLFGDSYLICYDELYNITSDILPFKFIQTSTQHYKDDINYNQQQILLSLTTIKIKDIDYKALQFYKDDFNIPYLFPDGHEDGLDHNQIFIYYTGKINLYEDYFTFSDDSVGNIIVSYNNIDKFEYLEERNYTVMLIKFKDMDSLPLSGIVKDEIIFYFKGNTERWRSYSREMLDFMRNIKSLRGKIDILNDDKKFEYEIVMKTMNENEIYNLSNISNSFNLTNICDSVNEMIEYEYLKYNNIKFDKFSDYKKKLNEYLDEINPVIKEENEINTSTNKNEINKENKIFNKKIMFVFGTNPLVINNIRKKLVDFIKKSGYKYNEIIPEISLYNINVKEKSNSNSNIIKYYIENINKIQKDPKMINIIFVYNICNILSFLKELDTNIKNFQDNFDILNISYAVNYSWIKADKYKNRIPQYYIYENIINNIFIEEGLLAPDKIEKFNKYITMANSKAKLFTTRSFYLNEKELRNLLFETCQIKPKLIQFYYNYYLNLIQDKPVYQNIFIPFKYMVKEDLFHKFFNNSINYPLFFKWKTYEIINNEKKEIIRFPLEDQEKPKLSDDTEYQKYLGKIVSMAKVSQIEPLFIQIFGNAILIKDEYIKNKEKRIASDIECNYKLKNIKNNPDIKNNNNIGMFILGKNLLFENNYDFYEKMLFELCGKFPDYRPYKKKEDITEKERANLNYINLTRPLPQGWSLEGPVVVDDKDEIHYEHPYLEQFIDEYIDLNNKAIDQYNNNVKKQIEDLLI